MRAPATAALLLAALSALPCRGNDADTASNLLNNTQNVEESISRPTLNRVYQMLHSNLNLSIASDKYENVTLDPNLANDECTRTAERNCRSNETSDVNESDGAEIVLSVDETEKRNRGRRKRGDGGRTPDDRQDATVAPAASAVMVPPASAMVAPPSGAIVALPSGAMVAPPPGTTPQPAPDRRRRPEAGSSSPLLNYIFDTYSNTHQHRNERVGNSNSIYAAAAPEAEALVGSTAHLDCKVDALHDKLVSWVRRKSDDEPMDLLTTGTQKYTADDRYSARFIPPDIWRLEIKGVRPTDAAHYDCQLSAHPPRTARLTLRVPEVSVRIVDGAGAEVSEQVCEEGSTVALRCEVRGLRMEGGPALLWRRRDATLNDDTTRGGISVRTEFGVNGANSVLRVARVRPDDAGRYSCSVARAPAGDLPPAHVVLHVIKGESLAELHQGGGACGGRLHPALAALILLAAFYQ